MYYAHFGLKQAPFKITPNTEFFFSGGNRGAVLDALIYAITSGEGIVKVVGEVGSGKTMLCRMLETLLPQNVESVYLANPSVAPEDILHAIAFELHLELPEDADRLQVMHALQKHLLERHAENRRVVIFIEEAQGMPLATLEEIRLLSNLETKHDKLLQIVLFGQPELDVNLNETHIRQLRERITHSFNLGPLMQEDIGEYLIFRLRTAGYFGPQLFTKGAIRKIAAASKGLVRRINILADKAMLAAFAENAYAISPKHVAIAIRDSEFGAEHAKAPSGYWLPAVVTATLLMGLGVGFGLHALWQNDKPSGVVKTAVLSQRQVASVEPQPSQLATEPTPQPASPAQSANNPLPAVIDQPSMISASASQPIVPMVQAPRDDADMLEKRFRATETWLAQQPRSTVSIQLMGTNDPDQLRYQLKNLGAMIELDNVFVYRTEAQGKPFFTVLYGSFDERDAASRALQGLPKTLRAYRPQLRTVGGILYETKQHQ